MRIRSCRLRIWWESYSRRELELHPAGQVMFVLQNLRKHAAKHQQLVLRMLPMRRVLRLMTMAQNRRRSWCWNSKVRYDTLVAGEWRRNKGRGGVQH